MAKKHYDIEEIKQLIPDYVMGRLSVEEKNIVEKSMENSTDLQALFNEISRTVNFVNTIQVKEPKPEYWSGLLHRIHERIEQSEAKKFSWSKIGAFWKVAVPVAAMVLIAFIYFVVINRQQGPTLTEEKIELKQIDSLNERKNENVKQKEIVKDDNEHEKLKINNTINRINKVRKYKVGEDYLAKENEDLNNKTENVENTEDFQSEEFISENLEAESVFSGGAGGIDDETEEQLDRLNEFEQEILIKKLKNSNL